MERCFSRVKWLRRCFRQTLQGTKMTVKQQLIAEIEDIDNPIALVQLFELMQLIKHNIRHTSNQVIAQFSGCIDDTEAQEMRSIINQEFSHIEGEW